MYPFHIIADRQIVFIVEVVVEVWALNATLLANGCNPNVLKRSCFQLRLKSLKNEFTCCFPDNSHSKQILSLAFEEEQEAIVRFIL